MGKLSSAIVQRKLAPLRDVEEALAHQVLYGSDLATNLLEQSPTMDEGALTALLAETLDLAPAPAREIPRSPDDTLHLVPGDVALRHGLYPLERQGQTLVVAVCDRLRADVEQDLAFGLGVKLEQRAAPLVRIRQAIGRDYGLPVDRRSRRVLAKLEGKPDPSPSVAPSPLASAPEISALPRPPSMPPIGLPASADLTPLLLSPPLALGSSLLRGAPATGLRALAAALPAPSIGYPEAPRDEESIHDRITAPPPPVAAADTSHLEGTRQPEPAAPPAPSLPPTPEQPAVLPEPEPPSTVRGSDGPAAAVASAPAEAEPPPRSLSGQHVISGMERTAWTQGSRAARPRARSRHRGPYTAADAEQDLLEAEDRDDILSALFDFASQYFEYSALFVVHGDLAEGRDSSGPGADRAAIAGIGVPLDLPSSLATVRTEGRFSVAPLGKTGMDARLAVDLNRKAGRKVLLLPVLVRGRSVVILYGDDGAEDVDLSSRGDIIAFAPLVAAALENLILRKKAAVRKVAEGDAKRPQSLQPVLPRRAPLPSRGDRAEALSQALQSTVREATLDEPPKRPSTKPAIPAVRVGSVKPPLPSKRSPTPSQGTPNNAAARARDSLAPNARAHDAHVHEETAPIPLSRRLATAKPEEPPEEGWSQAGSNQEDRSLDRSAPSLHTGDGPEISVGIADMEDWSPDPEPNAFPAHLQIVAPAQLPHKRHSSAEVRLPKVILNINDDLETLVRKIAEGDERAIERIADMGAAAASILVARLPGPLQTDAERLPTTEPASHRGPFLKALVRIGPPAIPFLAVRTNDTDPKIRALATHLLGELPSIEAAQAVARRITDGNAEVRRAALEAGRLLQSDEEARTTLRDRISSLAEDEAASMEKRVAALEALAHFRDPRTVPRVIRLVSRNDEIGQSAQWALGVVTRQAFGRDAAAWETWWQKNQSRHRIEWLIDALMHDEIDVRRAAGEELKALTKEYFGYYDDLAKAERAKSQTRYREWWESTGKGRFAE